MLQESDCSSMKQHNLSYNKLLDDYVNYMISNLKSKEKYKKYFFWFSFCTLIGSFILLCGSTIWALMYHVPLDELGGLISAIISFLTMFFVIPKIITKYLFNENEEDNMYKLINNMQKYDSEIRAAINIGPEKKTKCNSMSSSLMEEVAASEQNIEP